MFQKFVVNYWVWWYFIKLPELERSILRFWLYLVGYLNIVPMATNLFIPLYQDYTLVGRTIGFIIRINWVIIASFILIIFTIPIIVFSIIPVFLPVLPLIMILSIIL